MHKKIIKTYFMLKSKLLVTIFFSLFFIGEVSAQREGNELTVVWGGAPGYRPNTTFTINITKGSAVYSRTFTGPGLYAPPMVAGSNNTIGAIQGLVSGVLAFNTTYSNYATNTLIIGGPEQRWYFDTWDNKVWYFYVSKSTATTWNYRIGQ
jgi:hypothetical protein